jgi:hypothetical protein
MKENYFELLSAEVTKALTISTARDTRSAKCSYHPVSASTIENDVHRIVMRIVVTKDGQRAEMELAIIIRLLLSNKRRTLKNIIALCHGVLFTITTTAAGRFSKEARGTPFGVLELPLLTKWMFVRVMIGAFLLPGVGSGPFVIKPRSV